MSKWMSVAAGVVVLASFGGLVWAGNTGKFADVPLLGNLFAGKSAPLVIKLPAGTKLNLILRETLEAGSSKVDDQVDLVLAEDVKIGDQVIIPRGAAATGKVTKSRGASLASAIANRPARLEISLESIKFGDYVVEIAPVEALQDGAYEFTQKNTSERLDSAKIDKLWEDEKSKEALATIADKLSKGESLDGVDADVKKVAEAIGLKNAEQLVDKGAADPKGITLGKAVDAMTQGNVGALAGADSVLAAQALGEISDLVSSVDHKVRGVFKARTIRATIGTPIQAKTVESVAVTLPAK